MAMVVYMIIIFFQPWGDAPFDMGINTRTYGSLEECLAAIPGEIETQVRQNPSIEDHIQGAACVEPSMADAISAAKDD